MDWALDWIALAWVLAGVLIILTELVVTGFVAVFFGIAAIVTGIAIAMGLPGEGPWPFVLFSVVAVGALLGLRQRFAVWFRGRSLAGLGGGGADDDFIGRDAHVASGFGADDAGRGEIDFRGANWAARSEHQLAKGALVIITARDNMTLTVAPQEN